MDILQVTIHGELKYGGPPQKIFALSQGLIDKGHRVQIVSFHSDFPGGKESEKVGDAIIHYLPWKGRGLRQIPTDIRRLRRAVQKADIVHCYGLYNLLCPLAIHFARRANRPYLLEPIGTYVPRARNLRIKALYHRLFTFRMARGAARIIATSPQEAEELSGLAPANKLVIRRNGLDLSPFENLPSADTFRARFGIAEGVRVVLFLGRISPIKNLEELVRAFKLVQMPQTILVLVGPELEEDYAARLRLLVKELALESQVVFAGELYGDDKLSALHAADVFVLPSTYESYGNVAAEAVAAGIPVLLTKGCGIAPQIDRRAGLAVGADAQSLANGLRLLLDDEAQRLALTSRRREVLDELSWDAPLQQTELLYEAILKEHDVHSRH